MEEERLVRSTRGLRKPMHQGSIEAVIHERTFYERNSPPLMDDGSKNLSRAKAR